MAQRKPSYLDKDILHGRSEAYPEKARMRASHRCTEIGQVGTKCCSLTHTIEQRALCILKNCIICAHG